MITKAILRIRKGVPGVGSRIARELDLYEVTCNHMPNGGIAPHGIVINYGRSQWPIWDRPDIRMLNPPSAVGVACDKLETLKHLQAFRVASVDWTTSKEQAEIWLRNGYSVVIRHTLTGKQGQGVQLFTPADWGESELPLAPLYTIHYNKTHEFRVHVAGGKCIDYVQKKRMGRKKLDKYGLQQPDELLRNHKRGWVFAHNDLIESALIRQLGVAAVEVCDLDFGAADILAKVSPDGEVLDAVVCEVNSAPNMSSQITFNAYCNYFTYVLNQ